MVQIVWYWVCGAECVVFDVWHRTLSVCCVVNGTGCVVHGVMLYGVWCRKSNASFMVQVVWCRVCGAG